MLSQNDVSASKQTREQLEAALGLDTPIYIQYFKWIGALLFKGSLGNSLWTNTPVMEEILYRLPITFELGFMALIVALIVGIPIGVYAALQAGHRSATTCCAPYRSWRSPFPASGPERW